MADTYTLLCQIQEHYGDVIMGTIASQITSLVIVFSTVYLDTVQRKHQSSASLAFVWGIHRWPVNSPQKWPVTRKMSPFDDVIMKYRKHLPMPNTCNKLWICFHKKVHFLFAGFVLKQTGTSKYQLHLFSGALISLLLSIIDIQAGLLNSILSVLLDQGCLNTQMQQPRFISSIHSQ